MHCLWIPCLECLSNKDCNSNYSTCDHGACKCKDELIKEGKTCKHGEKLESRHGPCVWVLSLLTGVATIVDKSLATNVHFWTHQARIQLHLPNLAPHLLYNVEYHYLQFLMIFKESRKALFKLSSKTQNSLNYKSVPKTYVHDAGLTLGNLSSLDEGLRNNRLVVSRRSCYVFCVQTG